MGAAAEHRYSAFAAREAAAGQLSDNEIFVRDLNALPKNPKAAKPFGDIVFVHSHGGWFAECPTTGYGYFYRTLRAAVQSWRVAVFIENGRLIGQPA